MSHVVSDIFLPEVSDQDLSQRYSGHWIECLSNLDPQYGGLSSVVPQLGSRLAQDHGFRIDIASFSKCDETDALGPHPEVHGCHWPSNPATWLTDRDLRQRFRRALDGVDALHLHGLWETHALIGAKAGGWSGKPYVVSAHGMLEPWALAQKRLRKMIYAGLIERDNLNRAACLHALTRAEAEDYRRAGCHRPIAIIPNAVDLPRSVDASLFLGAFPEVSNRRLILFLGRLHRKKGLELLIKSWATLASKFSDSVLVLAGPGEANYRVELDNLVREHTLTGRVLFPGMLGAAMKWSALASADCFVLPSYSEGFSVAVLEAMGMGLPVIITEQCHVPEVTKAGAGLEIQPSVRELSEALEEILRNDKATNREIGNRGRRLVNNHFSWTVVAAQMAELYHCVLGGTQPQSFELRGAIA